MAQLKAGLRRSADRLGTPVRSLFKRSALPTPETFEALEELLIQSDMGVEVAAGLVAELKDRKWSSEKGLEEDLGVAALTALQQLIAQRLLPFQKPLVPVKMPQPWVCLMVGVNGSGKTTTAGKLASQWRGQGYGMALVAGDTFRAAAVEQLKVWAQRSDVPLYAGPPGCDSGALAFDSLRDATAKAQDILLIDTAGRLHNKAHLMDELSKVVRVLKKQDPQAPHCTVLVLDGTVGQNALSQVALFQKALPLSGLIVTKLDGTAKGGILLQLTHTFQLPIYALGVGEGVEDLQPFDAQAFAAGLVGH
jgi:fused signal recognition particle receptor